MQNCDISDWKIAEPIVMRCLRLTLKCALKYPGSTGNANCSLSAGIRQGCTLSKVGWPIIERIIKNLLNGIQETPWKTKGMFKSAAIVNGASLSETHQGLDRKEWI